MAIIKKIKEILYSIIKTIISIINDLIDVVVDVFNRKNVKLMSGIAIAFLGFILIGLKITNFVDWNWIIIFIPIWLLIAFWGLPYLFGLIGRLKHTTQRKLWGVIFLTPWILGFLLFFLKPLIETFYFSFNKVTPSNTGLIIEHFKFHFSLREWREFFGLGPLFNNYYRALRENVAFSPALILSTQTMIINLPVILIFSLLMAVVLNAKFKGRTFIRAVFFIPVIFNSAAVATALGGGEALRTVMEQNGLGLLGSFDFESYLLQANIATGLITFLIASIASIYDVVSLSGVQILIFLAGIQSIPGHLYEAAKIEGATSYEIFWKITLPMVSPMIITTAVYTIVDTYLRTNVIGVIEKTGIDYGLNAAMSWIYFGVSALILGIVLFILSKVVFYYDE